VPPCRSRSQTACLVAYSSYDRRPAAKATYGRGATCVNPADPAGGTRPITPVFPSGLIEARGGKLGFKATTPWVAFPNLYTATCKRTAKASWLQVDHERRPGDKRPLVHPLGGAAAGLHADDVNIALGDLVGLVRSESAAYGKAHK
jgi:hypothetical protein